jgi:hypothetical protein
MEWYYPLVAWTAVLGAVVRGIQVLGGDRGPRWLPLLAGGLSFVPVSGLPIGRWLHGFNPSVSIPFVAILLNAVISPLLERQLLDEKALRAGLWFGALAGLVLYPMAAGIGPFDPYELGWNWPGIELVVGGLSVLLLWRQNAFGGVLLLTGVAWRLGGMESQNVWDYLIDPIYFVMSVIGLLVPRRGTVIDAPAEPDTRLSEGTAAPRP